MSVVCSDMSLLDNINSLLKENGVISVEDEYGVLHYIVDGREDRREAAGKVTAISSNEGYSDEKAKEITFIKACVKTVLREYGFDMSLIGTDIIFNAVFNSFRRGIPLLPSMKSIYSEYAGEYGLTYEQAERDVRYAITRSSLNNMKSRAAISCIQARIERRLGLRDPLN